MRKIIAIASLLIICGCSQNNFSNIISAPQPHPVLINDYSDIADYLKDTQAKIDTGKFLTIEEFEVAYRNCLALQESGNMEYQNLGQEMQEKLIVESYELDKLNNTLLICMGILLAIFPILIIIASLVL